jgi:hypothetical protein
MRGVAQAQLPAFLVLLALAFGWVVGRSLSDLVQRVERVELSLDEEASTVASAPPPPASHPALAAVAELDGRLYHILVGSYGSEDAEDRSLWSVAFTPDD